MSELFNKEYYNCTQKSIEKIIYEINLQTDNLGSEDILRYLELINCMISDINKNISFLSEYDKKLKDKYNELNIIKNQKEKNIKKTRKMKNNKEKLNSDNFENLILLNNINKLVNEINEPINNDNKPSNKKKTNKTKKIDEIDIINNEPKEKKIEPQYCQECNIIELNKKITNEHQQLIINRISTDSDYAKVYLQNYEPNIDMKKKDLKGTIKILGNYNKQKRIREAYEVKVFDSESKGTFWCSCADHKFNSTKKNIVCKHICFIVCKVLKILQTYFFDTKKLTSEHLAQLLGKFDTNSEIWSDKKIVRKSNKITIQDFKVFPEHINDTCTFCYDEMTDADKPISVSCPLCKHCFHEECMGVWLESQSKCSYCSNNYWNYYKRIQSGEKEIDLGSNQL